MGVIAIHRVKMFGKWYPPGATLPDMPDAERVRLLGLGAAADVFPGAPEAPGEPDMEASTSKPTAAKAAKKPKASAPPEAAAGIDAADIAGPELPPDVAPAEMSLDELRAELDGMGVEYPSDADKATLSALLDKAVNSGELF